ncbi:MAG: hypothetical protein OQK55_06405 [Thermoanaerobaculales bacterium]|jgi:hypothetical protein|nr:hypothetical protein [Thermoanaerobaculales bacterium]
MFVPSTTATTGAITAAAAAEHQRKLQREEELMTKYTADEIEGWEFKIVRASTRKFKDPEFFRKTCEEEARAGWEVTGEVRRQPCPFQEEDRAPRWRSAPRYRSLPHPGRYEHG